MTGPGPDTTNPGAAPPGDEAACLARRLPAAAYPAAARLRHVPGPALDRLLRAAQRPGDHLTLAVLADTAQLAGVDLVELLTILLADRATEVTVIDTERAAAQRDQLLGALRHWARAQRVRLAALDATALTELAAACMRSPRQLRTLLTTRGVACPDLPPEVDLTSTARTDLDHPAIWAKLATQMSRGRRLRRHTLAEVAATLAVPPSLLASWETRGRLAHAPLRLWLRWCRALGIGPLGTLTHALTGEPHRDPWLLVAPQALLRTRELATTWGRWADYTLAHRGHTVAVHITDLPVLAAAHRLAPEVAHAHLSAAATGTPWITTCPATLTERGDPGDTGHRPPTARPPPPPRTCSTGRRVPAGRARQTVLTTQSREEQTMPRHPAVPPPADCGDTLRRHHRPLGLTARPGRRPLSSPAPHQKEPEPA